MPIAPVTVTTYTPASYSQPCGVQGCTREASWLPSNGPHRQSSVHLCNQHEAEAQAAFDQQRYFGTYSYGVGPHPEGHHGVYGTVDHPQYGIIATGGPYPQPVSGVIGQGGSGPGGIFTGVITNAYPYANSGYPFKSAIGQAVKEKLAAQLAATLVPKAAPPPRKTSWERLLDEEVF